jgi:Ferritin-like domain
VADPPASLAAYHALPLSRRQALLRLCRRAGVGAPVTALLEGAVPALARGEETDLSVLYAALALEHQAIWIYDHGLKRNLFPAGLRSYAVEFRGDHEGHRDTQLAIARERGGHPPEAFGSYRFGRMESGDDLIRQASVIERAAQDAYLALISQIRTKDYLLSAGFILIDEVRHLTVWRRVLGLSIW